MLRVLLIILAMFFGVPLLLYLTRVGRILPVNDTNIVAVYLFTLPAVLYFGIRAISFYYLPSFQQYKEKHPDLTQPNGKVRCCKCGDTGRRMWRWSAYIPIGPKKHYCSQCGKALYRS